MAQEETAGGGTLGRNPSFGVINPSGISPETAMRSIQEDTMQRRNLAQESAENEKTRAFQARQNDLDRAMQESQFSRSHQMAQERERFERMNADRMFKLNQDQEDFRRRMEEFATRKSLLDEDRKRIDDMMTSRYNQGILEIQADEAKRLSEIQDQGRKIDEDSAILSAAQAILSANTPEEQVEIAQMLTQSGIAEQFSMNSLMAGLEDVALKLDQAFTVREGDMSNFEEFLTPGDQERDRKTLIAANRAVGQAADLITDALLPHVIGNATIQSAQNAGQSASEAVRGRLRDLFQMLFHAQNLSSNYIPRQSNYEGRNFSSEYATAQKNAALSYQELEKMGVNVSMLDMAVYSLSKLTGGTDSAKLISSMASGQALEQTGVAPSGDAEVVARQRMIQGALNAFGMLRDDKGNRLAQNFGGGGLKVLFKQDPSTGKMVGYTTSDINKKVMELLVRVNSDIQKTADPRDLLDSLVNNPTGGQYQGVLDSLPDPVRKYLVEWAKNERVQFETYVMSRPEQFRNLIDPKTGRINVSRSQLEDWKSVLPTEQAVKAETGRRTAQFRAGMMPERERANQESRDSFDHLFNTYFRR
jgi:hypothetical protein